MSKNMTRKGLAFGAGLSLVVSGFAALPAQANGIGGNFVTVVPTFGDQYAVTLTDTFDLRADFATGIKATGQDLKFLVTDPNSALRADVSPGQAITSASTLTATTANASGGFVVVTIAAHSSSNSAVFGGGGLPAIGDVVTVRGLAPASLNGTFTVAGATAAVAGGSGAPAQFTYRVPSATNITVGTPTPTAVIGYDLSDYAALAAAGTALGATSIVSANDGVVSARAADNSFVVNSLNDDNTNSTLLRLAVADNVSVTRSATVTAWIDSNDNGSIDATEYISAVRTIRFMNRADITAQATLIPPKLGDSSISATIVTDPVLNGAQLRATDVVRAAFTRQGSSTVALSTTGATQAATTGTWTASVTTEVSTPVDRYSTSAGTVSSGAWAELTDAVAATRDRAGVVVRDKVATATIYNGGSAAANLASHNLQVGDKVTWGAGAAASLASKEVTVTSVPSASTFTFALDVADVTVSVATSEVYTVTTWGSSLSRQDRVFAGDYSAQAATLTGSSVWTRSGTVSSFGTLAATAADVFFTTTGSASVQGRNINTATPEVIQIKSGTLSVSVTLQIVDKDGAAVGAGRSVEVNPTATAGSSQIRINGTRTTTGAQTFVTNASGQVVLTITDTLGADGTSVTLSATPEGVSTANSTVKLDWVDQAYGLVDLNTTGSSLASSTRTIPERGSYTLSLMVADQWFQTPADGTYQVVVSGQGATPGTLALTAGRASLTITDGGVNTGYITKLQLQKRNTAGTFVNEGSAVDITNNTTSRAGFLLNADGASINGGTTADLSDAVAKVALVELDKRLSGASTPLYANDVVISGRAVNTGSNVGLNGAIVTVTGPSNILFENDFVAKRGSLTFTTASDGTFTLRAYSTTAQTNSVVTLAIGSVTTTVRVTFTGIGVGEGTKLDVTTPASVRPASTFQVKAKLSDVFANGVDTAANSIRVTYTGPGIVFGTLPNETDRNGELSFSVLLGANDTGNVVVTVSYDQNGDGDFVDAKDLNTTKTTVVGTGAAAGTGGTGKVNVGSFNGRLVVYAANLNGKRISWKVGGRWGSAVADSNFDSFSRPTPRAGVNVNVEVFVDGVSTLTKSVVTR